MIKVKRASYNSVTVHNKLCFCISALLKEREEQDRITLWRSAVRISVFYDYVLLCVSMCLSVTGCLPTPPPCLSVEQFTFLLISFVGTPSLLNMIKAF